MIKAIDEKYTNMTITVTVEVLTTSGCNRCQRAKALAKEVVAELDDNRLQYREVNVVEEIDYAVGLGLLSAPAIALNGELVFPFLPSALKLRKAILERLE
tara:strand:- start:2363 stop:2662 length:300 start_codon:yes stop_codon:yes gene_type:complete